MHASHLVWSTAPSNPTDEPCRFLGLAVPGGLESYFDELSEIMTSELPGLRLT